MDKLLLKVVALFKNIFILNGVDYNKMMAIVQTKLTMDKRRVFVQWRQAQQQSEKKNHLLMVMLFYGFMGFFIGMFTTLIPSLVINMVIIHTYIIVMMAMTLITDFSTVLLDTTDNQVLLPRPVSGKTLFMARLVHILIYILQFAIALSLVPLIVTFIKYGALAGLATIITITLSVMVAVFFSYLIYLAIITFASEGKVKDIITYLQIMMVIIFTADFQVLPRLIDVTEAAMTIQLAGYSYLFPPVWMALTVEAVSNFNFDLLHIGMISLAVFVPLITLWIMNKWMAPTFANKLAAINVDTGSKKEKETTTKTSRPISTVLASFICSSSLEKASFGLTWKMTGRDRIFKLQFYPSLGYIAVYIFLFVFNSGRSSFNDIVETLPSSNHFLWFIYAPLLAVSSSILIVSYNENFQAAWIYHSTPVVRPGELITGSVKALFVKYFAPVFLFMFCGCFFIWGWKVIDDFIYGLINCFMCCILFASVADYYLPFSKQPNTQQQSGKMLFFVVQMIALAILVGLHYLVIAFSIQWILLVLIPILIFASLFLNKRLAAISWNKIKV